MYSDEVLDFIYLLNNPGIKICLEGKNIKISFPEGVVDTAQYAHFIKVNRETLIRILNDNQVFNFNYNNLILRNNSKKLLFPLSSAQERILFIEKYEEGTAAFAIPLVLKLHKDIKIDLLVESLNYLVKRHEVLRTLIAEDDNGFFYQKVYELNDKPLNVEILSVDNIASLDSKLFEEANKVFNLSIEYPIKICIIKVQNDKAPTSILSIVIHHIAFDGWSTDILLRDLNNIYNSNIGCIETGFSDSQKLPELKVQYKDYAYWQRCYLKGLKGRGLVEFWKKKMSGLEDLNLPLDNARPKKLDYNGLNIYFEIEEYTSTNLRNLAKQLEVSLFSVMLTAYFLMLKCYTNQNNLTIGTPVANRDGAQVENLIGLFLNVLPIRIELYQDLPIVDLISLVSQEIISINLHQELPFERIVDELELEKDPSKHPLFQVMFCVQNFGTQWEEDVKQNFYKIGSHYRPEVDVYNPARYDITTFINDSDIKLRGMFNIATSILSKQTADNFIKTYKIILQQFAGLSASETSPAIFKVQDVKFVDSNDFKNLLKRNFIPEKAQVRDIQNAFELFYTHVLHNPSNIAITFEGVGISYEELNNKVCVVADVLKKSDDNIHSKVIAVFLERSIDSIVSLLAIIKLGAIYLPIDINLPKQRLDYILEDSKCNIIISSSTAKDKLLNPALTILQIDKIVNVLDENPSQNTNISEATDIAYMIYTSGSTGNPKGVLVTHLNLINFLRDMQGRFSLKANDSFLAVTTFSFDISLLEILLPLTSGARLVLCSNEQSQNSEELIDLISRERCTIMQATPITWEMLLESGWQNIENLKILCGGELMSKKLFDHFKAHNYWVWNLYGPTETTIWSTSAYLDEMAIPGMIGLPISETAILILDDNEKLLPDCAIGEICIAGSGVSKGYYNRPDLTSQRYIDYPIGNGDFIKLYKTGDLGRWNKDGKLEYFGRKDDQIKLRGFRIETGEIESCLIKSGFVQDAKVRLVKDQNNVDRLVAHILPANNLNKKKLQFSLFFFSSTINHQNPYHLYFESTKFADQNDFCAIWTPERHFHEVGAAFPNPSILSAALAVSTKNIKIRAGSVVLPLHNPIRIAEDWAVIDTISGGRVGIAFAAGWNPRDFVLAPENYQDRKNIMLEGIKTIKALWSGKTCPALDGLSREFDVQTYPLPTQQCPVWLTAAFSDETFIQAGVIGANILTHLLGQDKEELARKINLYRQILTENGFQSNEFTVTLMLHSFVDETTEEAVQVSKKPFCDYLRSHISLINKAEFVNNDMDLNSKEDLDQIVELAFRKYAEHSALIGDENKCMRLITELKRIGVDEIACFIDFGIENDIILEKLKYLNNLKIRSESIVDLESTTLIKHLKQILPAYMIPSIFLYHTHFQYTHNGKLDQKWLDKEAHKHIDSYNLKLVEESQYLPPRNQIENDIAKLWSEILDISKSNIAINSDFFKLGGHSILTIKLVNSIHKTFNIKISIAEVFDNKILEQQAQLLSSKSIIKTPAFDNSNKVLDTTIPLSFGQERLWFIEQYEQGTSVYNVPLVYSLREDTDPAILVKSLQDIIMRHQVLRSVIKTSQEGANLYLSVDTNNVSINFVQKLLKSQDELEEELYKEGNQIFRLDQSYPIRAILYLVPNGIDGKISMYLLIIIHHIAFDGWSLDIFEKELEEFYKNNLLSRSGAQTNLSLPNLEQQYGDFARWQRKYVVEEIMESYMNFWRHKLDRLPDFALAVAKPRPKFLNYEGDNIWFHCDSYSSQIIKDFAQKNNLSLFSILLSAFYMLLYKHSGEKDIVLGIPVANRHYPDVENLIGFFVNTLPVRIRFDTDTSIINFIKTVSNEIIEAQKHQDLPFDKIVSSLKLTKNINKHPIFQIMFENITLPPEDDRAIWNNGNRFFQHYRSEQPIQKLAKFDLNFFIDLNHKQLKGYCNYATALFEAESIAKIIEDYKEIIMAIALSSADGHDIPFTNLSIFLDKEAIAL